MSFSIVELHSPHEIRDGGRAGDGTTGANVRGKWHSSSSSDLQPFQLRRMGKLSLPVHEEQSSQEASSSFVNTHLSLTKVVRHDGPSIRSMGLTFLLRLGRVPPGCFSPRIQQTETNCTLRFLVNPSIYGDIRLLFACPSHSRSRILGTAATAR